MLRCLALAKKGMGQVAPNPMVGAVLVNENKIIGEGFHKAFGGPHAEVNCIKSVKDVDKHLISSSTLYVSLEPCNHFGKTPPCTNFIIKHQIALVVIGCKDSFEKVNGTGIETLRNNKIEVITGVLENKCRELNKRFFLFHEKQRPYVILKWAQTINGFISNNTAINENQERKDRLMISNQFSNRMVHKWRSEEAAILIGTRTAMLDNPTLTNRLWRGKNPVRLIIDKRLILPETKNFFKPDAPTIIFNFSKHTIKMPLGNQVYYYKINEQNNLIKEILNACYELQLQSILVEGGAMLHQSFINENLWDEARVITNKGLTVEKGLQAAVLKEHLITHSETLLEDSIAYYNHSA